MKRTVTISELLEVYDRRNRNRDLGAELEDRRIRFDAAQATGRIVLLDGVMPHDPDGALMMALVGSSCGHLVRLPLTREDIAAIFGYARDERIIV